jgi:hypothetical protein
MKKMILIVTCAMILISGMLLTGCKRVAIDSDTGPTVTRSYDFTDFNIIEIGYAFKLEVTPADTYSITINANESLSEHIKVTKSGDRLEIGLDRVFFHFNRSPRVKITMPELRGLHLSGASEGNVTGFRSSRDLDLTLSGASELNMDMETGAFKCELSGASELAGYLKAKSCDIELSGASETTLDGSGGNIRLDASGANQVDLAYFTVNNADINLSGASDASLLINGRMDVSLSGGSFLEYGGNPTLGNFDVTGGSELTRR